LKHRRLLVGSIIAIPVGVIFWVILGPIVAMSGISSHEEGWWIFSRTVTDVTTTYWAGVAISLAGLIVLIAGVTGIVVAFVLELLDRGKASVAQEAAVSGTTQ
jgi:hypothetical protein